MPNLGLMNWSTNEQALCWLCGDDPSVPEIRHALIEAGVMVTVLDALRSVDLETGQPDFIYVATADPALEEYLSHWRAAGISIPIFVHGIFEADRMIGTLRAGASDFVVPPFRLADLVMRLHTCRAEDLRCTTLALGKRIVDLESRSVQAGEQSVRLTKTEAKLLAYLSEQAGRVVDQDELLVHVWGYTHPPETRAVANTVMRLRPKIEEDPKRPQYLLTVHGRGVQLVSGESNDAHPPATELPEHDSQLIGREAVLADVTARLDEDQVLLLHGPPGVGKTRIALEAAKRSPKHPVFLDLSAVNGPISACQAIALGLRVPLSARQTLLGLGEMVESLGDSLLILDGAQRVIEQVVEAALTWCENASEVQIVITTTARPAESMVSALQVPPLAADSAVRMLKAEWAALTPHAPFGDVDDTQLARLVDHVDRLPISVRQLASQLRDLSVSELMSRFENDKVDQGARFFTPRQSVGVEVTLEASWSRLDRWGKALLSACTLFPTRFRLDELERLKVLFEPDAPWTADVLDNLHAESLVQKTNSTPRQFYLLGMTRTFVREKTAASPRFQRVATRFSTYMLSLGQRWSEGLFTDEASRAANELERLVPILNAIRYDMPSATPKDRVRATLYLGALMDRKGVRTGQLESLADIESEVPPELTDDFIYHRARCLHHSGFMDEAVSLLEAALSDGDPGNYRLRYELAFVELRRGHFERCKSLCVRGETDARLAGDTRYIGLFLDRLAALARRRSHYDEAERLHLQSIEALATSGSIWEEAEARANYALVHFRRGELERAVLGYERALENAISVMNQQAQATARGNLGSILTMLSRHHDAREHLDEASHLHRHLGQIAGHAMVSFFQGRLYADEEAVEPAIRAFERAATLARRIGDARLEAISQVWLGMIAQVEHRLQAAAHHQREARRLIDQHMLTDIASLAIFAEIAWAFQTEQPMPQLDEIEGLERGSGDEPVLRTYTECLRRAEPRRGLPSTQLESFEGHPLYPRSVNLRQALRVLRSLSPLDP
ncbi:MAG: winged helix-turn-helix domain-containing protein [Myxococcota bacterium]|nr:winged helix-turn-helix domain-containing protein [Myxococcota bacterium]